MTKRDDDQLKQARDKFKLGTDADEEQRKREREARRMYALDQWPEAVLASRQAQGASGIIPATPARPCLVVDRLREPVHQIVNQERESDLAVELIPADDFGGLTKPINPTEIELREGLIRRIQRESESASARTWAFTNAAIGGRGYYAINTRYIEGKTFDQEVYCRRIYDQDGVVLDPSHEEPDGSDAEWAFNFTVMSHDAYNAAYPFAKGAKNKLADCGKDDWTRLGDQAPGWFTFEGEERYVRVADHWYTVHTSRNLCEMDDGSSQWEDELPKDAKPKDVRPVLQKAVKFCKIDGCQILEETDWPSPYIPIIKIVGNEIPPCDQERRVDGMVNKSAIESQRALNYMVSKLVEEIGLSAVSPLLVEEGTIEGYEGWWNQSNTRAFAYLPFKRTNLDGQPGSPPHRPDKHVAIAPMSAAIQMFGEAIQISTGVSDPQMGKPSRFSETWRGTQALINQSQRGTSNYMDNLTRSVRYEGRIMDSLLYPIYGRRPGRMTRIVKGEGESETVFINQPFTMQDNGQGKEIPTPAPGMTSQTEGVREYVLTPDAKANVAVKIVKGFDTRRQEEAAMLGDMLTQNPQLITWFGDSFFGAQDWPGAAGAKKRAEVMLDPKIQAMLEQEKGGQSAMPPMAIQQIQQLQQQLDQTTQAAQGMQQELQGQFQQTQMKIQSDQQIAQLKAQADVEMQRLKTESDIRIAEIKAGVEVQTSREKDEAAMIRQQEAQVAKLNAAILEAELQPVEPAQEQV